MAVLQGRQLAGVIERRAGDVGDRVDLESANRFVDRRTVVRDPGIASRGGLSLTHMRVISPPYIIYF